MCATQCFWCVYAFLQYTRANLVCCRYEIYTKPHPARLSRLTSNCIKIYNTCHVKQWKFVMISCADNRFSHIIITRRYFKSKYYVYLRAGSVSTFYNVCRYALVVLWSIFCIYLLVCCLVLCGLPVQVYRWVRDPYENNRVLNPDYRVRGR